MRRAWRFALDSPAWQFGREYSVKAVIAPAFRELYLDGLLVERGAGGFVPEGSPSLVAGASPEWAAPDRRFHRHANRPHARFERRPRCIHRVPAHSAARPAGLACARSAAQGLLARRSR